MELASLGQAVTQTESSDQEFKSYRAKWDKIGLGAGNHPVGHQQEQWQPEASHPDLVTRLVTYPFSPEAKNPELLIGNLAWNWGHEGLALSEFRERTWTELFFRIKLQK